MGLNEVFEKISKIENKSTELASHEVELGMFKSVKEIQQMFDDLKGIKDKTFGYKKQINDALIGLENTIKSLGINTGTFITEANKTITEAKALGLEVPANIVQLTQVAKSYNDYVKAGNKFTSSVNAGIKTI
jgi:regulator of replication initiation timing